MTFISTAIETPLVVFNTMTSTLGMISGSLIYCFAILGVIFSCSWLYRKLFKGGKSDKDLVATFK